MKEQTLEEYIDSQSHKLYGRTQSEAHKIHQCVACGGVAIEFANKLSKRVYNLMSVCQTCQDLSNDDVKRQAGMLVMMVDLLGLIDKEQGSRSTK